jgi:hypothetical protein
VTYATPDDVAARLGRPLTPEQIIQVQAWLDDIEAEIRSKVPNLDVLAADPDYLALLIRVECAAVLRVVRNPDGKMTERIDDYSWTRDQSTASGSLFLTDDEWGLLTPESSTEAFTIRPYGAVAYSPPDVWTSTT